MLLVNQTLNVFKVYNREISNQKDFGHVSFKQIAESENKWFIIDNREKILALTKKPIQIQAKSCDFYFEPCISW